MGSRKKNKTAGARDCSGGGWTRREVVQTVIGIAAMIPGWVALIAGGRTSFTPAPTPPRRGYTLYAETGVYALTGSDALRMHEKLEVKVIRGKSGA